MNEASVQKWTTALTSLRDLALFVATETFVLGYLVWALFAWSNDLGTLPALEARYFATGIITNAFLAAMAWVAYQGKTKLLPALQEWVHNSATDKRHRMVVFSGGVLCTAGYLTMLTVMELAHPKLGWLRGAVAIAAMVALWVMVAAAAAVVIGIDWNPRRRARPWLWRAAPYLFLPIVGVLFFWIALVLLYEFVPPSLGGGKAQCASLDVIPAKLSNETLTALGIDPVVDRERVARSVPLRIHFVSQAQVVVTAVNSKRRVEVAGEAVMAKIWCDREGAAAVSPTDKAATKPTVPRPLP